MDLHIVGAAATAEERAAIDGVIDPVVGPAVGGWDGGERVAARDGRVARAGHQLRERRHLLLPALHAVQDRVGWISQGALAHVCRRLAVPPAEAWGVATFYALLATSPMPRAVAHVCDDIACRTAGAEALCARLEARLGPEGEPSLDGGPTWRRSPCLGQCDRAPAAYCTIAGDPPSRSALVRTDADALLAHLAGADAPAAGDARPAPLPPTPARLAELRRSVPQAGAPGLRLLARVGRIDPTSLEDHLAMGGHRGLRAAVAIGPERVIEEVTAAELLGRGGAAFPAGRKLAAARATQRWPKVVVCNADEAEPGTFKDRVLLEEDPFALIEAMTIAAYATGAELGYVYLRGEYPVAEERLANAIARSRSAGLLGPDVDGAGLAFEIEIRRGGGAYVCGEATALLESIEGKRGEPRSRFGPLPTEAGLFGLPTLVNNVETLANLPAILLEGGAAHAGLGTAGSRGHKLFSVSGHVARPGVYEVEFGTTLGELLELAGGVAGGRALRTVNLGGAAGAFVGPDALGLPLTYEGARAAGATLGAGAVVVFDETTDLLGILRRIAAFFRDESCGQCVPCRVGTVRQEELLARLASGRTRGSVPEELALLGDLGEVLRDASICGLGQTANEALRSGLPFAGVRA